MMLKRSTSLLCSSLRPHKAHSNNFIGALLYPIKFICTSTETGETNKSSKKKKFEPHRMTADELTTYGKALLRQVTADEETKARNLESGQHSMGFRERESMSRLQKQLPAILHFLIEQIDGKSSEFIERISEPEYLKIVGSENISTVVMRYYAEQNDITNVRRIFTHLKDREALHVRSFVPLISQFLRSGKLDEGMAVFRSSLPYLEHCFSAAVFCEVINVFTDIRTSENEQILMKHLVEVFDMLNRFITWYAHDTQRNNQDNQENLAKAIMGWFSNWRGFIVKPTVIDAPRGWCRNCKQSLKLEYELSPGGLERLKRRISALINDHATKFQGDTTLQNYMRLGEYLEDKGHFDVVVDGLNVCYQGNNDFHPWKLRAVVEYFINLNKRVLVIGAGKLQNRFLEERYPEIAAYLHSHCDLYLFNTSVIGQGEDDQYFYYTLCHHNFQIELVSNDLFRDVQFFLGEENKSDFLKWQQRKQYVIESFHRGVPRFYPQRDYEVSVQRHSRGWHVPIDGHNWLCIFE